MSEPQALQVRIDALRSAGAWRRDPMRFRTLEALARRLDAQEEPVRGLLQARLAAAVAEFEARCDTGPAPAVRRAAPAASSSPASPPSSPLAALNVHLAQVAAARSAAAAPGEPVLEHELASVRRFRQAWHASHSLQQVEQALERRPSQAGPLNSHALVLQSLDLMRALSPEYLRRFLLQVESLQWLEQAGTKPRAPAARPAARRSRAAPRGRRA